MPLDPSPLAFVDPETGAPAFGSYAGPLPPVVLGQLGARARVLRKKAWVYVAIATPEIWLAFAVVRTGYAATAFAFACDLASGRMLADERALAPPPSARVAADAHAAGPLARFAFGRARVSVARGFTLDLSLRLGAIQLDASVDEPRAAPPLSVIAPLGPGRVSATEKRVLLPVRGEARVAGRRIPLDGATAGYDFTVGLMPRRTRWRWAFALGRADGAPFAMNLTSGFVGGAECAVFGEDHVAPVAEPRFHFDRDRPLAPWRLDGEGVDLTFEPAAAHEDRTQLLLVRSRFVQPVGHFSGTLRAAGRDLRLDRVPGVVEDQDVVW